MEWIFLPIFMGCYIIIYYTLKRSGITHEDKRWWIIMITVVVMRIMALLQGALK